MSRTRPDPTSRRRSPCPVAGALDLLGDRWTLLVVRDLFAGLKRYGDFAGSLEKIPTNLLADRLARLARAGLIRRTRYQGNPPRFEYTLTPAGEALRPVMQELVNWGRRYVPGTMMRAEVTGNPADSPFLPSWIKQSARARRAQAGTS
jgi:DNA-binding HxlR family transcriptional regulator